MKSIKKGFKHLKDVLGVITLMLLSALVTVVYINPEYVGFKAWCVGEACEEVFMFEEPTDEQLVFIAKMKLYRVLVDYCKAHDIDINWMDLKVDFVRYLVWGDAHRNVKFEYEWINPVTNKKERNIKNIRIVFGHIGEFINPYTPTQDCFVYPYLSGEEN